MELVVETGAGLPNATTFATRADLIEFAAARGLTVADVAASDVHLVNAMDALATRAFLGVPVSSEQGTPFPRTAYVRDNSDDLLFPNDSVPAGVKRAQLLLALASARGVKLLEERSAGQVLKARGLGPLKREYGEESIEHARIAGVDEALAPYINASRGIRLEIARA